MNTVHGGQRQVADGSYLAAAGRLPRLLPERLRAGPASLGDHLARHGQLPAIGRDADHRQQLIAEVGRAGLTGRGGARFPTARKLAAVAAGRWSAMVNDTREQAARDRAVTQLKKRRDFRGHLLVYVLVNAFLVVIWAVTDVHGFFWPVFPIVAWGIGVVMNAWDVYWRPQITEQDIQHEIEREDKRI